MAFVTENILTQDRSLTDETYSVCASDMGLAVTDGFPNELTTDLHEGQTLIGISKKVDKENELLYVRYKQNETDAYVIVFND